MSYHDHVYSIRSEAITSYLAKMFSVNRLENIKQLETVQSPGYASTQYKFDVTDKNSVTHSLFVKSIDLEQDEKYKCFDKEVGMYTDILPCVTNFTRTLDKPLASMFSSCFVKYHASFVDDEKKHGFLILDDIRCSEEEYSYRNEPEVIVAKLGLVNGCIFSWAHSLYANTDPFEVLKAREYLTEFFTSDKSDSSREFFATFTSAIYKIIVCTETLSVESKSKLDRILKVSPLLRKLRHRTQEPRKEFYCPTLGDVHHGNVAVSRDLNTVLFYDFGNIRLSSPLIDFHHFTAGSLAGTQQRNTVEVLFEIYAESFTTTCEKLGNIIPIESLESEFHVTKNWQTITRYFVVLLTLMFQRVSRNEEQGFVRRINSFDIEKDRNAVCCEFEKFGNPAKKLKSMVLDFLKEITIEDIESLETGTATF